MSDNQTAAGAPEGAPASAVDKVTLLVGGDLVFVFAKGDDRIGMQATVMIAANLDVETFTIAAHRWPTVEARLLEESPEIEITDCRKGQGE